MDLKIFFYYLFSSITLISAIMVITVTNPIHSILFLVLVFLNASGLLILLEAEFIAILFIVVYVGAIGVLFLFVIMMLPTHGQRLKRDDSATYLPIGLLLGTALIGELIFILLKSIGPKVVLSDFLVNNESNTLYVNLSIDVQNVEALGQLIYTECSVLFIVAGLILLVSMLGAITLTIHRRGDVHRQKIYAQTNSNFTSVIGLKGMRKISP